MSNMPRGNRRLARGGTLAAMFAVGVALTLPPASPALAQASSPAAAAVQSLSPQQRSIAAIAAAMASGDMPRLDAALHRGLDAGLAVGDAKEVLIQLYAYAGFPRSLNALGQLMKVVDGRKQRGIRDAPGREPSPVPNGSEILAIGTANQTKLIGAPARSPLYEFAPAIDDFLKRHLFGDIFVRDNLDWQSREIATVGALAAMPGVESQLQSHVAFSFNVGLTAGQIRQAADALDAAGQVEAGGRIRAALERHGAAPRPR